MGKIKGWEKIKDTKKEIIYKGDDGDRMVITHPKNDIPAKWIAGANSMLHIRTFQSKKEAISFAIGYMRKYPRG